MKDIKQLSEEEVQERIQNLDDEITKCNTSTIPKIIKLLEEEEIGVVVSCYSLISIVNAFIKEFGTEDLLNECMYYLQNGLDDVVEVSEETND